MLRLFIRSEIKEAIILLVFAGLLFETLSVATVGLVALGSVMVWFKAKPSALIRNILTLALFGIYWITYGKVIDPEVGLNFLTSIIAFKLLEKSSARDQYMIFFGLILLISAGSLFEKRLSYVIFFSISFLVLILDFYKNINISTRYKDLLQSLVWVLPFTALLFIFVPRIMNPFQLGKSGPREGEVGYTPEVNISRIDSLASNDSPVFQVTVDRPLDNQNLYWRGNTLTFSDGWNWPFMPGEGSGVEFEKNVPLEDGITQKFRLFSEQPYYFGFDHPQYILSPAGSARLNQTATLAQNRWKRVQRYQVISQTGDIVDTRMLKNSYTGLKASEKEWINQTFKSSDLAELTLEIENYFLKNNFSYSFSPGRIENILEFMQNKKIGFCSHYASAVGLILRTKNIPTRLVSGFMGGSYNRFGGFYLITHNDAHVWVEALSNGKWKRLDPTGWIAPDRVLLGGEGYMQQQLRAGNFSVMSSLGSRFAFFNDFRQWFAQWDFRFYQWLEEMDYYGQEALFDKLKIRRTWIFSVLPVLLALFMGLYTWQLSKRKIKNSELERMWFKFQSKLKKQDIDISLHSVKEAHIKLESNAIEKEILKDLVDVSFRKKTTVDIQKLKERINRLN